jgi:hypothetical protein
MPEHTHKRRVIQAMINKIENTMTKMVEALGIKTSGALVVYILFSGVLLEWEMKWMKNLSVRLLIVDRFSQDISPCSISAKIVFIIFIRKLIGDIVYIFIIIIFTIIRRGVDMVEWTVLWVVLRQSSFTVFALVIRAERFEMASLLTLEADTLSHIRSENFVDEQRQDFISREGGCSPMGMNRCLRDR